MKHEKIEKVTGSRDDKGEGKGSIESGCWTEAFLSSPWVGRRPMIPPVPRQAGAGEMTKLLHIDTKFALQDELSSRPG
jgi:hypothetical protein